MARVAIRGLRVRYGSTLALDGLDLDLASGEILVLLGASGSGKTTLLRVAGGFLAPEAGTIALDDRDITALPPHRRPVSTMFQSYALFPHLSCVDNVAFSLKMRGVDKATRRARALEFLERVAMTPYAERLPAQLSGGQQQRVALARALVTEPQILLLDEPLSALDPFLRVRMRAELRSWQRTLGIPFVHVTHGQDEALALADLVVVMNKGRIEQAGPPRDVFETPATEFIARFLGGHNVIDTGRGKIALRSDRVRLVAPGEARLKATVTGVEYQGPTYQIALKGGDGDLTATLGDAVYLARPIEPGETVALSWADADAHPLSPAA